MTLIVIWLVSLGYAMLYLGVSRFGGSNMTFGQALGASQ